jgi:bla regulator protein blaR1
MKLFILYQVEVAICLAVFYLFYKLLLSQDTRHQIKRAYIIATGVLALLIPLLTVNLTLGASIPAVPATYITQFTRQFTSLTPAPAVTLAFDPWLMLCWIWVMGSLLMISRLIFSLFQVHKILHEASVAPDNSCKITGKKIQSFSFFRTIVLNARHYQSPAMKFIMAHEQTHANQLHSLDILFIELLKSWQWFNPFVWLLARESVLNLEYIADNKVVTIYDDIRAYQFAIVQFSHHAGNKLLHSEFSKSNLKSRINMMSQTNNQRFRKGRYILLLPVILILLMSFSFKIDNLQLRRELKGMLPLVHDVSVRAIEQIPLIKSVSPPDNNKQATDKNQLAVAAQIFNHQSSTILDKQAPSSKNLTTIAATDNPGSQETGILNVKVTQDTTRTITGRVTSKEGKAEAGVNVFIRGTTTGTVTASNGRFTLVVGASQKELIVASPDRRVEVVDISENDEFEIILMPYQVVNTPPLDKSAYFVQVDSSLVVDGDNQPLFIIDDEQLPYTEIRKIDPNTIDNITVLKGKSATKLYGDKATNGVVIIELKERAQIKKNKPRD